MLAEDIRSIAASSHSGLFCVKLSLLGLRLLLLLLLLLPLRKRMALMKMMLLLLLLMLRQLWHEKQQLVLRMTMQIRA